MTFTIRWPDGAEQQCYSPSLVMHEHLTEGGQYPVPTFVGLARRALNEASDRVRARFGVPCSRAAASLASIEAVAAECDAGSVTVVSMTGRDLLGS